MTNALTIYKDFEGLQRAAMALNASGYFRDVKSEAQALVKVMAGAELGIPPFASMSGIHIIQGKPTLGSNIIATLVKNDQRYDYRVKKADNTACVIEWFENGAKAGESSFTIQEAQGITTKEDDKLIKLSEKATWRFYTSDMLFARAISRGARRFAPGIFGGSPVYTPDEMGVDVDEDGYIKPDEAIAQKPVEQEAVDGEYAEAEPEPLPEPVKHDFTKRPYDAETLRAAIAKKAKACKDATEKQVNLAGMMLAQFFGDDTKCKEAKHYLLGVTSLKEADQKSVTALLNWMNLKQDSGGAYVIDEMAQTELGKVLDAYALESGQDALFTEE